MREAIAPTGVRIPPDLKRWLKEKADDNRRSLTAELIYRLEESRKHEERQRRAQHEQHA